MAKGRISTKTPNVTWFRNVAKSLGFTSTSIIDNMIPNTGEFFKVNADSAREITNDLRELKSRGRTHEKMFTSANGHLALGRTALKNALSDIKSGKIYNKERQDNLYSEDMDSDFSMDGFDFDGDDSSSDSSAKNVPHITIRNVQPPMSPNSPIVKMMNRNTEAVYKAAQVTNENNAALASSKMVMDHRANMRLSQGLSSINENLAMLVNFHGDTMSKYIGASLKYYEESLDTLKLTVEELKRGNSVYHSQQQQQQPRKDPSADVFLGGGGLNAKGYMDMVKKNMRDLSDSNIFLSSMKMMFQDTDTLKYLAASPLSFVSTKIVATLVPKFLQQTMQNFDKSFANFFPAMFMRFGRMTKSSSNPFVQALGELFGVNTNVKTNIDLGKYQKGPVPFDGITKKAIVEVIPGYLRKILSALNGKEDIAYDHEDGKWKKISQMRGDFERRRDGQAVGSYEANDNLKRRSEAIVFEDKEERKAFNERIDKFFVALTKYDGPIRREKGSIKQDDLMNIYDFENPQMLRMFQQLISTMSKSDQMKMFGTDVLNARRNVNKFMDEAEMDPSKTNANLIYNNMDGLGAGGTARWNPTKRKYEMGEGGGLPGMVDKFGMKSTDYLRDIKQILLQGITVYGTFGEGGGVNPYASRYQTDLTRMGGQRDAYIREQNRQNNPPREEYSDEEKQRMRNSGRKVIGSTLDMYDMSDDDIRKHISDFDFENDKAGAQKGGIGKWIGKFFKGDTQEKYNLLREKVDDVLKKPAELLKSVFDKIDGAMYNMAFGTDKDDPESGGSSFMSKTVSLMREKFNKMGEWINGKIIDPLKESLFGKDGVITKIKDSDFMKNMKTKMKSIQDFMFGKATGEDGKREGGLFADTANNMADMWDGMKYYFTGKGYTNRAGQSFVDNDKSVFGEVKQMFGNFKDTMKSYFMGNKKDPEQQNQKGVLGGMLDSLKDGFRNFGIAIFGPNGFKDKNANETFKEMTAKIKARAPKALAGGLLGGAGGLVFGSQLGLLGSLFLPGGPIGGAIVSTTLGFLTQSDRFNSWMFGKKDANGDRLGGFISKNTQDFLKKHKVAIIGGAGFGVMKSAMTSFGLLPSMFIPGGPIGGAIMGIGASLLFRSEAFQKMMFGEKDADGKRVGGIIGKAFGGNKQFKNLLGNVGAGGLGGAGIGLVASKLGIMGAMLVPGGPIGGAILGAATGIALSSDRWKKALFGEWDEETGKRNGGLFGKFQNWFKLEVQEPLKLKLQDLTLNMKEWFTTSIANPFQDAISPLKQAFSEMIENMQNMFAKGWESFKTKIGDVFEKNVGQPFGKFMEDRVMKPLRGFFNGIVKGVGKVFGTLFASPFKALSAISQGVRNRQEKRGVQQFVDDGWNDMGDFKGRRERGERMGLFNTRNKETGEVTGKGMFGRFHEMYFNKDARQAASVGPNGASYGAAEDKRIAERNKLQDEEFKTAREKLKIERERLNMHRKLGLKYDYENFNDKGQDISRIYDIYQKVSKEGVVDGTGRKLADKLGISLDQVLGPDADASNLSKQQKKRLSNAIKRQLNGSAAKNLMSSGKMFDDGTKEADVEVVADEVKHSADAATDKLSASIGEVKDETKESNKFLSGIQGIAEKILHAMKGTKHEVVSPVNPLGSLTRPSAIRRLGLGAKITGKIPKITGEHNSHASGLDSVPYDGYKADLHRGELVIPADKANTLREILGMSPVHASSASGPINRSNQMVNSIGGTGKNSVFGMMSTYLRTIAVAVHGQLDGVGSNVFKIRKIIQNGYGISDGDITGSANKDRVGIMGKLRNLFFRPFDAIRQKLTQGLQFITDKVRAFGEGIKNVTTAILMVPVNLAKGVWNFTKHVGEVVKETALNIAQLPVMASKMLLTGLQGVMEGIKMIGPAIGQSLYGVAKFFSGAMVGAGNALIGFGKGVGNFFEKLGEGAGKVLTSFGRMGASLIGSTAKLIGNTVSMVTDFTLKTTRTILDGTLNMLTSVSKKLLDVGESMLQMVASPLKFFAQSLGKFVGFKQEVVIKGGSLDSVGTVGVVNSVTKVETVDRVTVIDRIKETVAVYLTPDKVRDSFKHMPILPVTIQESSNVVNETKGFKTLLDSGSVRGAAGSMTNSFLKALEIFDVKNDAEKAGQERADSKSNALAQKRAQVSRKTADYQLDILRQKEKEEFQVSTTNRQLGFLEQIASATTEQKDSWMSIFGKKGILTAALLLALPFLKDIIGAIKNLIFPSSTGGGFSWGERQGPERTDGDGTHVKDMEQREDIIKTIAKGYTKYGAPVVKGAVQVAQPIVKAGAKLLSPVVKPAAEAVSKTVAKGVSKVSDTVMKTIGKSNTVKSAVIATNMAANVAKETISDQAAKIQKSIMSIFDKFFGNSKIADMVGSAIGKVGSKIKDFVARVFTGANVKKYMGRLSAGFLKTGGKGAASAATLGITDAAFATWDLSTGAFEAAHMFQVNEDAVDAKMRIAASVTKAMFGWFPIVAVLADIISEIVGVNLKEYVASSIYAVLASEEKVAALEENQNAFEQEWAAYNDANGTKLTKDAYNDKVNKTVAGRIGDAASAAWGGVKSAGRWVGDKASQIGGAVWDGTKWAGGKIADAAMWTGGKIADAAKWTGGAISDAASATWSGLKTAGNWVGNQASAAWNATGGRAIDSFFDAEQIKKNFNVTGDGKITTGMKLSSGAGNLINMASMGLIDTEAATKKLYDLGIKAQNFLGDVADGFQKHVSEPLGKAWDWVSGKVSDVAKGITDATGKAWDWVSGQVSEDLESLKKAASETWTGIKNIAGTAWDKVTGFVTGATNAIRQVSSKAWTGIKNIAGTAWDKVTGFVTGATNKMRAAASKSWEFIKTTAGTAWDKVSGFVDKNTAGIRKKASEVWQAMKDNIGAAWDKLGGIISDKLEPIKKAAEEKWEDIKKSFGDTWDGLKDTLSTKWDSIKTSVTSFFGKIGDWFTGANSDADNALKDNGFTPAGGNGGYGVGGGYGRSEEGGFGGEPKQINGFKYYSQNDEQWKNYNYDYSPQQRGKSDNPRLGYRGCGPTSMAMVASQLTGQDYQPPQLADLARAGNFSTSAGTTWAYFPAMAKKFGLNQTSYAPSRETLTSNLQKGMPVILSGRRRFFAADQSPFTQPGHFVVATGIQGDKIMINDPRGAKYSKGYSINNVLKEARQAWAFTRGDGSVPPPAITNPSDNVSSTLTGASSDSATTLDLFSKLGENFSLYVDNVFNGTNKTLSWGDPNAAGDQQSSSAAIAQGLAFVPKTTRDKILKKVAEMTISSESGGNYYYARNDTSSQTGQKISPSIGILQWREGNAKRLMQSIAQKLPGDSSAQYYANAVNWNDRSPWSSAQQQKLEAFLKSNSSVVKSVQEDMAMQYINGTNLAPVYKYGVDAGKLKDPRSIAMLAEFANTGPAHVKTFLNKYSSTSGAEWPHFLQEFKSKSYWGGRSIYNSRVKNVTSKLQNWDPEQGGYGGMLGGFGEALDCVSAQGCGGFGGEIENTPVVQSISQSIPSVPKVSAPRKIASVPTEYSTSYRTAQPQNITISGNGENPELLAQMIVTLKEIAKNTGATTDGIVTLYGKDNSVIVNGSDVNGGNNSSSNVVVVSQNGGNRAAPVVNTIQTTQAQNQQTGYSAARGMALGRKK